MLMEAQVRFHDGFDLLTSLSETYRERLRNAG